MSSSAKPASGTSRDLETARRADEEDLGRVACHEFARHGEGGNKMSAGAAAGDENA